MKLSEVFERIGCGDRDELARRVSNTSRKQAAITAEEIERGVTLERLETIGVPVYRYQTQITIHGRLPDFAPKARPLGYKAIFKNQNGSLGVRYVAIDAEKKRTIARVARFKNTGEFAASISSTGLTIFRYFNEKADCLAALARFPRNFYGSVYGAAMILGGYVVAAEVGAIDDGELWKFIRAIWNVESMDQLIQLEAKRDAEEKARHAQYEAERIASQKAREESFAAKAAAIVAELRERGAKPLASIPAGECKFVAVRDTFTGGVKPITYSVRKGSFGRLFYSIGENTKQKVFDAGKRASLERSAAAGYVFGV